MDAAVLREIQAPLKERYRDDPATVLVVRQNLQHGVPVATEVSRAARG
jgi:hypothetical protein